MGRKVTGIAVKIFRLSSQHPTSPFGQMLSCWLCTVCKLSTQFLSSSGVYFATSVSLPQNLSFSSSGLFSEPFLHQLDRKLSSLQFLNRLILAKQSVTKRMLVIVVHASV